MKKFILGRKLGMTQIIDENGLVDNVTAVASEGCSVVDLRTAKKNGYNAVILGYENSKKSLNKPKEGYFKSLKADPKKIIKEFRVDSTDSYDLNQIITLGVFEKNEKVNVKSKSNGKGFAGTIKRHNFSRGPMTHGSKNHRMPGSIGGGTDPGRVMKGTKMGGHMGNENVTVKNLEVIKIDIDKGFIFLKGAVPGKKNSLVEIFT